jgi:hypothetical protein
MEALEEEGPDGDERVANVEELVAGAADLQARLDSGDPELALELETEEGQPAAPCRGPLPRPRGARDGHRPARRDRRTL